MRSLHERIQLCLKLQLSLLLVRVDVIRYMINHFHFEGLFLWESFSVLLLFANVAELAEVIEKEEDDFEQLARDLENASPLEIMDKALEKFGNDIAIAFRYCF